MIVLAADTSTTYNSVAVCDSEQVLVETAVKAGRKHSERLLDTVDWTLSEGGLALSDVGLLAISAGPGSFTGLRVGVATWKGLAVGAGLPLLGVPTLDALSRLAACHEGLVCPMLDARMSQVFTALYRFDSGSRSKTSDDRVCALEEAVEGLEGPVTFLGEGALLYKEAIRSHVPEARFAPHHCHHPRASVVALEALARYGDGGAGDPGAVTPVYLRRSQAEEQREQSQQKRVLA